VVNPMLSQERLRVIADAIETAHHDYERELLRRALYKTNDVDLSQDLVQNTFLKTFLYLRKGGKVDLVRAFLNHILNDLIVDQYRKHKVTSLDTLLEKGYEPSADDTSAMIDFLDGRSIVRTLTKLPPRYERVVTMRYLRGMSLKEIADNTKQSQNTIAVQIHRGLKKLKKLYMRS
jgi:RNA polymerase sigma-70 factor (ECF subfamily)